MGNIHPARQKLTAGKGRSAAVKIAFMHSIPVLAGYVFLGITYGILMVSQGFPPFLPVLTAAVVYTGSMEFLLVSILASSFNPASAFVTAFTVGARHLFYGISMLNRYKGLGPKTIYLIFATSDETFAVNYSASLPERIDWGQFYFWVTFLDQCYWIAGAALGALFGSMIRFNTRGLDFVMTAMFVSIFMDQWLKDGSGLKGFFTDHISEFTGLGASALCLLIFGPDHFIIPSMIVILAVLALARGKLDGSILDEEEEK